MSLISKSVCADKLCNFETKQKKKKEKEDRREIETNSVSDFDRSEEADLYVASYVGFRERDVAYWILICKDNAFNGICMKLNTKSYCCGGICMVFISYKYLKGRIRLTPNGIIKVLPNDNNNNYNIL